MLKNLLDRKDFMFKKYYLPVESENKTKEVLIYIMNDGFDKEILNQTLINTMDKIIIKKF